MEWLDILRRVEAGESEHIEFKRGLGDLVSTGRAICAFANTDGGVIILGVDDSGTLVGVQTS
jgi:predicted HTH transcriptional regulator